MLEDHLDDQRCCNVNDTDQRPVLNGFTDPFTHGDS